MQIEKLEIPSERRGDLLYAEHRHNGRFFNPWAPFPHSLLDLMGFWLRPKFGAPSRRVEPASRLPEVGAGGASVTWVGHCTFAIREGDDVVLTDPHWGRRSKTRVRKASAGLAIEAVPATSRAVVSHAHYDHLDRSTVSRLPPGTRWFVPLGLGDWFRRMGRDRVIELDWWHRVRDGNWSFTCLPAQHWSLRLGLRRDRTLWCSWLIESPSRKYYFAGDSGYFHGFREFGERFRPIDVAMLPIGTYRPRRQLAYQHMDPGEAYRALLDLGARVMLPMHWGTFQMAWDGIDEAPQELFRAIVEQGGDPGRVRLLDVGESWIPDPDGARHSVSRRTP